MSVLESHFSNEPTNSAKSCLRSIYSLPISFGFKRLFCRFKLLFTHISECECKDQREVQGSEKAFFSVLQKISTIQRNKKHIAKMRFPLQV